MLKDPISFQVGLELLVRKGRLVSPLGDHGKVVQIFQELFVLRDRKHHRRLCPILCGQIRFPSSLRTSIATKKPISFRCSSGLKRSASHCSSHRLTRRLAAVRRTRWFADSQRPLDLQDLSSIRTVNAEPFWIQQPASDCCGRGADVQPEFVS